MVFSVRKIRWIVLLTISYRNMDQMEYYLVDILAADLMENKAVLSYLKADIHF